MKNNFEYSFITAIEKIMLTDGLVSKGDKIVVGVSGGADSVCLLIALCELSKKTEWKLTLYPVHINHGIRGEEAYRDELFVETLCKELGLEPAIFHEDIPSMAKELSMSSEEAGRAARYHDLIKVCERHGCRKIAVAHNGDDQTETILFNILRGCSLSGLSGMKTFSPCVYDERIDIIRPLLKTSRTEIEKYLIAKSIKWCTDSTNMGEDYTRNIIRNILIPKIKEISPKADEHIKKLGSEAADAKEFIDGFSEEIFRRAYIEKDRNHNDGQIGELKLKELESTPQFIRQAVLYRFICCMAGRKKDIERIHVRNLENLIENSVGKMVCLPYDINITRTYDSLLALRRMAPLCNLKSGSEKYCLDDEQNKKTDVQGAISLNELELNGVISRRILGGAGFELRRLEVIKPDCKEFDKKERDVVCFDFDKVKELCTKLGENLLIRTREDNDYLCPFPEGGRKALRRIFIDCKLKAELRDEIPLLCIGSRCLVAGNLRHDETLRIDENTKKVLEVTFKL